MPAKPAKQLFPWILEFEKHLEEHKKVILMHQRFWTGNDPMFAAEGAFVQIVPSSRVDALNEHRQIDLMMAISRGHIGLNKKTNKIEWGGAVCYSVALNKL